MLYFFILLVVMENLFKIISKTQIFFVKIVKQHEFHLRKHDKIVAFLYD